MPETQVPSAPEGVQGQPEQKLNQPLSFNESFEVAKAEAKKQETEKQAEETQKTEPAKVEETSKPDAEKTTSEKEVTDKSDMVTYDGQEMAVPDLMKKLEFEIKVGGKMKTVDGDKLIELAGFGLNSSEKNRIANETIEKAEQTIKEVQADVEKRVTEGIEKYLTDLFDQVDKGIDPSTGRSFKNDGEKSRAKELLDGMDNVHQSRGKKESQSLTLEDVKKLVEEGVENRLKSQKQQDTVERQKQETISFAQETLKKISEPYKQFFLKPDGTTLNQRRYGDFLANVQEEAKSIWEENGSLPDKNSFANAIEKAANLVIADYKETRPSSEKKPDTKVPVLQTTSGNGAPVGDGPNIAGMNYDDAFKTILAHTKR